MHTLSKFLILFNKVEECLCIQSVYLFVCFSVHVLVLVNIIRMPWNRYLLSHNRMFHCENCVYRNNDSCTETRKRFPITFIVRRERIEIKLMHLHGFLHTRIRIIQMAHCTLQAGKYFIIYVRCMFVFIDLILIDFWR